MVAAEGGNNILQIFTIFGESTYLHFLLVESIYLCVHRKDYTLELLYRSAAASHFGRPGKSAAAAITHSSRFFGPTKVTCGGRSVQQLKCI